jgi:hypothetical protein
VRRCGVRLVRVRVASAPLLADRSFPFVPFGASAGLVLAFREREPTPLPFEGVDCISNYLTASLAGAARSVPRTYR